MFFLYAKDRNYVLKAERYTCLDNIGQLYIGQSLSRRDIDEDTQ